MPLSKSRILSALQCPKRLHFEVHQPDLAVYDSAAQARFDEGNAVGEAARVIYDNGRGVLIEYEPGMSKALAKTVELMEEGPKDPIFEATFEHGGVLIRADVLLPTEGGWRLVEVKSSAKVKDEHVADCALQAWVFQGAGYELDGIALAHVDSLYVYPGGEDLEGLLVEVDQRAAVEARLGEVSGWVSTAQQAAGGESPEVSVGGFCLRPYKCPFFDQCWPSEAEYPVFGLGGSWSDRAGLVASGYQDIRDVPAGKLNKEQHLRIHRISKAGEPELLDDARVFARRLPYPRYHLDFETVAPAIPIWPGARPYQVLPVQWSCHIEESPEAVRHEEFLDLSGEPPMKELAESLIETLGTEGPILTYSHYEKTVINNLWSLFPELEGELSALLDRLVDLLPVTKANYYHPAMLGSWSLKAVLPTIAPDLDYSDLEEIQDGTAASRAYLEAIEPGTSDDRREYLRQQLLDYCRLDTEAMVRLLRFLGGD